MQASFSELHGPGLWTPATGWLLELDFSDWDLSVDVVRLRQKLYFAVAAQLERLIPGIDCPIPVDPGDLIVAIVARLVQPVRLHAVTLGRPTGVVPVERRLIRSRQHELAGDALALAVQILNACLRPRAIPATRCEQWRSLADRIRQRAQALTSHAFTNAVLEEAAQRGVRAEILLDGFDSIPLLQLGTGSRSRILTSTCVDSDSFIGAYACQNKMYSQAILRKLGFPVPRQIVLSKSVSSAQLVNAAATIGYPCVLKPCDAERGLGVSIGIRGSAELIAAAVRALAVTQKAILVEEHVLGDYHRLVVIEGRLVRVTRYQPPHLIGDGLRSIRAILSSPASNLPLPGGVLAYGSPPQLGHGVLQHLQSQGLNPDSVPPLGMKVVLRCDLQDREDWIDTQLLDRVDPSLYRMAEGIARSLGMLNVGIDVLSPDITQPPHARQLWVIEVNSMQRMHPAMAPLVLSEMFPKSESARIPVQVVVCMQKVEEKWWKTIYQLLASHPESALAIPGRLAACLDSRLRFTLEQSRPVMLYRHPREVLLRNHLQSVLFLIDWLELRQSGLPAAQVDQLFLLGKPPTALADHWHRLEKWVEARVGSQAFCDLPVPAL